MDVIAAFLRAIPSAAASPLAFIAYLATVVAWGVIAYRVNRFRELMRHIKTLPEKDRLPAIKAEMGVVDVPEGLTGEQYLRKRIHTFVFVGWLVLCAAVATVGLKAAFDVYQQMVRADNLTLELLLPPSSPYMSAVNTLANGPVMVSEAAAEIKPKMTQAELDEAVARMAREGMRAEQIAQRLRQLAGTDRLRRANEVLSGAAVRLDDAYSKLEACFRQVRCRPGFQVATLCKALASIRDFIVATNESARNIAGVNFNMSGTTPILGGGAMDVDFSAVGAANVNYLLSVACAS
ncbi:hypothetical protein V1277_002831 [Bradyrhizobium sp. AZCC 1588]|uniref:hypothetical protein n=1 Tax=unclassified Bradyrhizobium TaxID=2631580 RepID=UPI002FF125D9